MEDNLQRNKIDSVRLIKFEDKRLAEVIEEHQGRPSSSTTFSYDEFFLDPLFWQSLGKGCGWEDEFFVVRVANLRRNTFREVAHVPGLVLSEIGSPAGTALLITLPQVNRPKNSSKN
jgi:hypothetical protein